MISGGTGTGKTTSSTSLEVDSRRGAVVTIGCSRAPAPAGARRPARDAPTEHRVPGGTSAISCGTARMRRTDHHWRGARAGGARHAPGNEPGHEGSMTTVHANNPRMSRRIENMVSMAGPQLPSVIRQQTSRRQHGGPPGRATGGRRIVHIGEITGMEDMICLRHLPVQTDRHRPDGHAKGYSSLRARPSSSSAPSPRASDADPSTAARSGAKP